MEGKQDNVVSDDWKGQDSSTSPEKSRGSDSSESDSTLPKKKASDVSLSSAAADTANDKEVPIKEDGELKGDLKRIVLPSNLGSAKTEIGFKLPQRPLGKVFRPSPNKKSNMLGPKAGGSTGGIAPSTNPHSPNLSMKEVSQEQSFALRQTNTDEVKSDVHVSLKQSENENMIHDDQISSQNIDSMVKNLKEDTFAAPILPPKQRKLLSTTKPARDCNVSSEHESDQPSTDINVTSSEKSEPEKCLSEKGSSSSLTLTDQAKKSYLSSKLSPAEKLAQTIPLPYKEPSWSGVPQQQYHLEILKGGAIISKLPLNEKPFVVFGRLESCDVELEHPSLSRYHMILQYRLVGDSENDPGFYVYDLDSTHGSFLNKQKLKPKTYCRMRVGHMFKLAGSTRLYILQGPAEDQEAESELSVTELKQMREKQLAELEQQKMKKKEEDEEKQRQEEEDKGISWGMGDDAEDEDPSEENPFAVMTQEEREALYIKDPKKTLRGFFEREGFELEYDVEEKNTGHGRQYVCRVELPVDDAEGKPITAEAVVSGKKKEAVVACALEACRILDAQGVLRQAKHESKKRKAKNWAEDDYYDSDDDTFLDRTGEIEKKRKARMKKAGVIKEEVETFASLTTKLAQVEAEIKQIDDDITSLKSAENQTGADDSLDAFMSSIKSGTLIDKSKRAKLKIRKIELRKDQARLLKLINIARPAALPEIKRKVDSSKETSSGIGSSAAISKKLPMIGSLKGRLGAKKFKFIMPVAKPVAQPAVSSTTEDVEEEEEEEEEEEDNAVISMETESTVQEDKAKNTTGPSGDDASVSSSGDVKRKDQPSERKDASKQENHPVKGPMLPPNFTRQLGPVKGPAKGPSRAYFEQYLGNADQEEEEVSSKTKSEKPTKAAAMETEEDVTDWVPPKDQTGDGRTALNEKYGY